jgi:serine protease Do
LGLSVSAGIVSGTERQSPLAPRTPLIQTDAASNPGNSGGALIDLDGRVVGISEGGYGSTEGFQGIGLAIPINLAKRVAQQLIVDGKIPRVTLGFDTEVISSEVAEHLGIANKFGLIVTDVKSQMPAAEGGLRVGDVVVAFNDKQIRNSLDLLKLMERVVPGSEIALSVIRERQPIEIKVRSKELSDKPKAKASADTKPAAQPSGYQDAALGLTLEKMSPELADKLGYASAAEGLVISYVRPKSPAAKEELFAGMVILRIDGKPVRSLDEYQRMTGDRTSEDGILMLIGTPRRKHFVVLRQ